MIQNRVTTPEKKKEILDLLLVTWEKSPELRLGQMIWNTFNGYDFFYIEDIDFINAIDANLDKIVAVKEVL